MTDYRRLTEKNITTPNFATNVIITMILMGVKQEVATNTFYTLMSMRD